MEALYTQWFHTLLLLAFISLTASQTRNGSDITCSTTRECQSHDITCSPNSDCTVTCSGQTSCLNTNIYGPQSNNNLTLICYVDSCRIANIYGPSDGNVYIRCKRWQSCIGITVHAESGTDYLDILVTETGDSFWGGFGIAKIYCPISQTPKSCSLRISGLTAMPRHNPSTLISSMHIYAQNGYRDIDISCEGWQSVDECFDSLHPGGVPLFFCGTSFDYACFTAPRTIEDKMATDWRCNNDTGITDDDLCSVSNTMPPGIYGSHFYCVDPFIPAKVPTILTSNPAQSPFPSKAPSNESEESVFESTNIEDRNYELTSNAAVPKDGTMMNLMVVGLVAMVVVALLFLFGIFYVLFDEEIHWSHSIQQAVTNADCEDNDDAMNNSLVSTGALGGGVINAGLVMQGSAKMTQGCKDNEDSMSNVVTVGAGVEGIGNDCNDDNHGATDGQTNNGKPDDF
eukprot:497519_1